jgi:hypothetical protein
MIVDDGSREKKVLSLLTRAARDKLTTVDLALPHPELVIKKKQVRRGNSSSWVYKANEQDDDVIVLLMPDMGLWLDERAKRAPVFHDIYGKPDHLYTYGIELRCKNTRAPGEVGGWSKEPTHARFYFVSKDLALLFKLTWGGA